MLVSSDMWRRGIAKEGEQDGWNHLDNLSGSSPNLVLSLYHLAMR